MKINHFVIDTNVIVSALFFKQSIPFQAVKIAEKGIILHSESTLAELREVLNRRKFDKYLEIEERQKFLIKFVDTSRRILIQETISICRDAKDNKFLELAVNGDAQFIITGDQDLLVLQQIAIKRVCVQNSKALSELNLVNCSCSRLDRKLL